MPTATQKTIVFIAFDGFQLLDLSGPASVFANANLCQHDYHYDLHYASAAGGNLASESGLTVQTEKLANLDPDAIDTVIVAGGPAHGLEAARKDQDLLQWLLNTRPAITRLGSVCSGAFILAEAGLLDGLNVATHWVACDTLQAHYPALAVDSSALYIRQGDVWTSAGVSTGIDMALAMVEDDTNAATSNRIARNLVLYARRPGHQQQFSDVMEIHRQTGERFASLLTWIEDNLHRPLTAADLAKRSGMSERNFFRQFQQQTGMTPSATIRNLRLEKTRLMIEAGQPLKRIAALTGFSSTAHMSAAFKSRFGMTVSLYRDMHGPSAPS